ncbi:MAG: site-specific DNA-methyltransferase [Gammaproteobacteria bacterium]|nr:site-specific DNA-methyltransferase [Gammaproteobacteria bacterium]MBU2425224.1 site-specific DNA-methyltransferase [Gammaproteobacteria bacterium]
MQLLHGDCLDIMPTLPDASVDAIIADIPYGTTACKWDSVIPFEPMWAQLKRLIKPRGAIVLFGSQPFTSALVMSNIKWFKYEWVWRKSRATGHLNAKLRPLNNKEDVCVFCCKTPVYYPQGLRRINTIQHNSMSHSLRGKNNKTSTVSGGIRYEPYLQEYTNYPTQTLNIASEPNPLHPTQKPVTLMEYLIRTYTNEGETVLDFTMGSGTTGVACVNTGREFIGIEQDAGYFEIATKRIETAQDTLQLPLLAEVS